MKIRFVVCSLAIGSLLAIPSANADYISPNIKDKGHEYTDEKPLSELYGTGQGGRLVESSELRMAVDGLLRDHKWEEAEKKARKAVQLDPGYPENHLLLARALVGKLYGTKGTIDEKLLAECIREWNLIKWHDADPCNQLEAKGICTQLNRISKTLEKDRQLKAKMEEKKRIAEMMAKQASESAKPATVAGDTEKVATPGKKGNDSQQLATKRKRWLLF